ncbi:Ig-like domain-containing protein [Pseudoalteromonas sp. DL2-H2.2]|uniref:Ig-like domain-containing protein n=1 Tax=Pseudoalteromonas sp. DL2-H2.2 TaxID=2908889 RepID=UPI001F3ACE51|nr:Ig-like domain-containing protein [Pseudoalteromonas sp. DL2-H2.2]MCF2908239.1 Ig-like domain-containing protein [Pseudoalteromonas sp. DL2-H2.2]
MSLMRWFSITLLSLLMIACGGGGSIEKDTSGGDGTTTDYDLVLSTSSDSGGSLSISNPITITAKLTNDGAPVANNLVNFSNDEFSDFASVSSQLTDSNGEAKVTIIANRLAGAGTISATADVGESTVSGSVPYAATGDGGIQIAMSITGSDGQPIDASNPISGAEVATVTAILTDNGTPLSGQVLEFSKEVDSEDLLVTNGNSNVQTDANGAARLIIAATDKVGAGYVQVKYNEDISARIGFESAGNPFYDKEIYELSVQLVDASEQASSELSLANPLTAKIQLTLNEQPVANVQVAVSVEASARFAKPTESVRTNANGLAEIQIFATETATIEQQLDAFTATYSVSGNEVARTVASYVGAGDGGLQMLVEVLDRGPGNAIDEGNPLSASNTGKIVVTLTRDGVALQGQVVSVNDLVLAELDDGGNGKALTDDSGRASFDIKALDNGGLGTFNVSLPEIPSFSPQNGRFYSDGIIAVEKGITIQIISIKDSVGNNIDKDNQLDDNTKGTVIARVLQNDKPLEKVLVEFTVEPIATLSPSDGRAQTNEDGDAEISLNPTKEKGIGIIKAKYTSEAGEVFESAGVLFHSDGIENDEGEYRINARVLTGCLPGWDSERDSIELNPNLPSTNCTDTNQLESSDTVDVFIKVTDKDDEDIENDIIEVTSDIGQLLPAQGRVLTDRFGIALLKFQPGDSGGAGTITAQYKGEDGRVNFSVGLQSLFVELSATASEENPLKAGGSMVISANVYVDEFKSALYLNPIDVEFTSNCVDEGLATIDQSVSSEEGQANTTYRANGCRGLDTVTATVVSGGGVNQPANITFAVSEAEAQAIQFLDASQSFIGLPPGIGGVPTTSTVRFKLIDSDSRPLNQKRIDFKISDLTGDALLTAYTGSTDNEGVAQTTIRSGIVPGDIIVEACYISDEELATLPDGEDYTCWQSRIDVCTADPTNDQCPDGKTLRLLSADKQINAVSSGIVLSSGVPDQNSFDAGAATYYMNALNTLGFTNDISIFFGDQFNQLTGDNIVANVQVEAGIVGNIDGEGGTNTYECLAVDGRCTVQWRSQGDMPFTDPKWGNTLDRVCDLYNGQPAPCRTWPETNKDGNILIRGGRVSVLVTAKGQETFIDRPSTLDDDGNVLIERRNGRFDQGEFYSAFDLPEAFVDHNEDGKFLCDVDGNNCGEPIVCDGEACEPNNTRGGHNETFNDANNNGIYDNGDGIYNGLLCSEEAMNAEGGPYCSRELVEVRKQFEIIASGNIPYVRFTVSRSDVTYQFRTGETCAFFRGMPTLDDDDNILLDDTNCPTFPTQDTVPGVQNLGNECLLNTGAPTLVEDAGGDYLALDSDNCPTFVSQIAFEVSSCENAKDANGRDIPRVGVTGLEVSDDDAYCDFTGIDLTDPTLPATDNVTFIVYYSDLYGNSLPEGTEVQITTDNGVATVSGLQGTVSRASNDGVQSATVTISREQAANSLDIGNLTVQFTIPSPFEGGESSIITYTVTVKDAG